MLAIEGKYVLRSMLTHDYYTAAAQCLLWESNPDLLPRFCSTARASTILRGGGRNVSASLPLTAHSNKKTPLGIGKRSQCAR